MDKKPYVLTMAVFIILVSFLPAISPFPFGIIMPFPIFVSPVLSFPFYAYSLAHTHHGISFFTVNIIHTTELSWGDFFPFIPFSFFLFVNFVGAMLGYEISKIHRIREWGNSTHWNLFGFVLGMTFLGCVFVVGAPLFVFGILVLTIVIGRILWSKISETP
jgi:hypothetical protein